MRGYGYGFPRMSLPGDSLNKGKTRGRSITRLALGIESRQGPASMLDEGSELREGYGRSKGENLTGDRLGTVYRPLGAGIADGRSRGPEAVRSLRWARPGRHKPVYGDARLEARSSLGDSGGAL